MQLAVLAALMAGTMPSVAVAQSGQLQICRSPGIRSITDGQPITLPPGFQFADTADIRDRDPPENSYRPVRLALLQPVTIGAQARCAMGPATVVTNPREFPVGPDQHRLYSPAGIFTGAMPEVRAMAMTGFR
jgi:hypothetical protein